MKSNFRFMLLLAVFGMLVLLSWPGELLGQDACVDDSGSFIPPKCDGDQDGYLKDTKKCLKDYGENCPVDCDDSVTGDFCSEPPDSPEIRFIATYWDFQYAYDSPLIDEYWICKREITNQHGRYYSCPYGGDHPGQTIRLPNLLSNYEIFPGDQLLKNGDDNLCRMSELDGAKAISTGMLQGFSEDCATDICQSGAHTWFSIESLPGYKLAFVATDRSVESQGNADPFIMPQMLEMEELTITFRKAGTMRKVAECRYDLQGSEQRMILYVSPCDDPSSCVPAQ